MKKKYRVTLTAEERNALHGLITAGKAAALMLAHARILLKADDAPGGPGWTDARIAEAVEVDVTTVERVRQRFVEQGFEAALVRKRQDRPSRERKLDGKGEARLVTLACSTPPNGRAAWTLRLLADRLVELQVVEAISIETVRQVLKKTNSSRGGKSSGASRRRRTPSSWRRGRTSWTSTTGPTMRSGRWSAWMRRASSWSARWWSRSRPSRESPSGSTTSTSGTGRPTCSCCPSRCWVGGPCR